MDKEKKLFEEWWKANGGFKATLITFNLNQLIEIKKLAFHVWMTRAELQLTE